MEEDRNVESPSTKRYSRSWKSLASQMTHSERMKKTGSSRDRKEPWQESERRRDGKAVGGGYRQEGKTWIQNIHQTSFVFQKDLYLVQRSNPSGFLTNHKIERR